MEPRAVPRVEPVGHHVLRFAPPGRREHGVDPGARRRGRPAPPDARRRLLAAHRVQPDPDQHPVVVGGVGLPAGERPTVQGESVPVAHRACRTRTRLSRRGAPRCGQAPGPASSSPVSDRHAPPRHRPPSCRTGGRRRVRPGRRRRRTSCRTGGPSAPFERRRRSAPGVPPARSGAASPSATACGAAAAAVSEHGGFRSVSHRDGPSVGIAAPLARGTPRGGAGSHARARNAYDTAERPWPPGARGTPPHGGAAPRILSRDRVENAAVQDERGADARAGPGSSMAMPGSAAR